MQIIDFSKIEIRFFSHLKIKTRDHCDCRGNLRFFQYSLYIDAFLDQMEMIFRDFPDLRPVHERNNVAFVTFQHIAEFWGWKVPVLRQQVGSRVSYSVRK